jgi:hypothetical protein
MKKACIFNIKRTIKELNHSGSRRVHEDFQEEKGSHRSRWFFSTRKVQYPGGAAVNDYQQLPLGRDHPV